MINVFTSRITTAIYSVCKPYKSCSVSHFQISRKRQLNYEAELFEGFSRLIFDEMKITSDLNIVFWLFSPEMKTQTADP